MKRSKRSIKENQINLDGLRPFFVLEMDRPETEDKRFRVIRYFAETVEPETHVFREVFTPELLDEDSALVLAERLNSGLAFHIFGRDELELGDLPSVIEDRKTADAVAVQIAKATESMARK